MLAYTKNNQNGMMFKIINSTFPPVKAGKLLKKTSTMTLEIATLTK